MSTQMDGQSERTNQTIEIALRVFLSTGEEGWVSVLPYPQGSLNRRRYGVFLKYVYLNKCWNISSILEHSTTLHKLELRSYSDLVATGPVGQTHRGASKYVPIEFEYGNITSRQTPLSRFHA